MKHFTLFMTHFHRMIEPKAGHLIFLLGKLEYIECKIELNVYRKVNQVHSFLEEKN